VTIRFDPDTQTLVLSVRDLAEVVEPVRSSAGLAGARRAQLGVKAHNDYRRATAAGRAGYVSERVVKLELAVDDCTVRIVGRVDAVYEEDGALVVEEIKSSSATTDALSDMTPADFPNYVQQVAIYRFVLEATGDLPVRAFLVMASILDGGSCRFEIDCDADDTRRWIEDRAREFIHDAKNRHVHVLDRRRQASDLPFPFETPTGHQEALMDRIESAMSRKGQLLLCAPTGSGKTAAALFGTLRRAFANDLGVFYVTSKNTQQQIVLGTLRRMRKRGACVTGVQIRSRESMCIDDVGVCHPESCPFLQSFRRKLVDEDLLWDLIREHGILDRRIIIGRSKASGVCPFEVALALSERVDVVTCDYNFVFDPKAFIRRHFGEDRDVPFLLVIDEAHNLYNRAREYYSPEFARTAVSDLLKDARGEEGFFWTGWTKWLRSMNRYLAKFVRELPERDTRDGFALTAFDAPALARRHRKLDDLILAYLAQSDLAVRRRGADAILDFYYALGYFIYVAGIEGHEFSHLVTLTKRREVLRVLCKDPARMLSQRLERFAGVVAMSATLVPDFFFRRVLGFREEAVMASFDSPFPTENRRLLIVPSVSTRFRDRPRSIPGLVDAIAALAAARPGNYIVFFPSFAYLDMVRPHLRGPFDLLRQDTSMDAAARDALLARLAERPTDASESTVLLAVQGGIFAEGVDYPGEMLSGVMIVGPGLPRVSLERELMREYYQDKYDEGFNYAYLYPGINRVVQSAGRVIRSDTDRGVIVLAGQRFARYAYASNFPDQWREGHGRARLSRDLAQDLADFWHGSSGRPKTPYL